MDGVKQKTPHERGLNFKGATEPKRPATRR